MARYTVIATSAHSRTTATYHQLRDAVAAAYWYGWDRTADVRDDSGRLITTTSGYRVGTPTTAERAIVAEVHTAHYWQYKHRLPDPLTLTREVGSF